MSGRGLKVWGGTTFLTSREASGLGLPLSHHGQYRCIIAAQTQKRAAELAGEKMHSFRAYWCTTGNAVELSVAVEEGVWVAPNQGAWKAENYKRRLGERSE